MLLRKGGGALDGENNKKLKVKNKLCTSHQIRDYFSHGKTDQLLASATLSYLKEGEV